MDDVMTVGNILDYKCPALRALIDVVKAHGLEIAHSGLWRHENTSLFTDDYGRGMLSAYGTAAVLVDGDADGMVAFMFTVNGTKPSSGLGYCDEALFCNGIGPVDNSRVKHWRPTYKRIHRAWLSRCDALRI